MTRFATPWVACADIPALQIPGNYGAPVVGYDAAGHAVDSSNELHIQIKPAVLPHL
jgi:hypothetical protein